MYTSSKVYMYILKNNAIEKENAFECVTSNNI